MRPEKENERKRKKLGGKRGNYTADFIDWFS